MFQPLYEFIVSMEAGRYSPGFFWTGCFGLRYHDYGGNRHQAQRICLLEVFSIAIEWTEDLTMGIDEIDNQHKELFRRIDQLLSACNQRKGKDEIGKIIEFLGSYVVEHFGYEERYMDFYQYPESAGHKEHHRQFISSFQDLKNRFEADGPGVHIIIMTNRAVVGWLNSHIRNVDRSLGVFLRAKMGRKN